MLELGTLLDRLASHALPDGGWDYNTGKTAHLEPTCLGLLAMSLDDQKHAGTIQRAWDAVERCKQSDDTYRQERPEALWPTSLVLFAQAALGRPDADVERTARTLLRFSGQSVETPDAKTVHDIDTGLKGWSWSENTFSWVDPTAWACLALTRAGHGAHPRVLEGQKLLLDRTFEKGGVNCGNRLVFGRPTDPNPSSTTLMLLALQGHDKEPRVIASMRYLIDHVRNDPELEHAAWGRLAVSVHPSLTQEDDLAAEVEMAVRRRAESPWLPPSPLHDAITALALGVKVRNFFATRDVRARPLPESITPARKTESWFDNIKTSLRSILVRSASTLRPLQPTSAVHVAPVSDYNADLVDILSRQFEHFRATVPLGGKRVVLKPNMVEYHRDKVINTDPRVVSAAIELCKREGAAEVIVAEGPGHWRNVEYLVQASGLGDVLRHHGVRFVDLNHDEPIRKGNMGQLTRLEYLYIAQTIISADVVVSMPKLKTHHWVGATLSLKNLFGTVPGICYGWPKNELHWRGIDNSIVDIALTRTPNLAIVDGIVGMEGDGPLNGTPKPMGLLIMGSDLLAVDATCCRLMQMDPEKIGYLAMGARLKLGQLAEEKIQQLGETIATRSQPFETLKQFNSLHWKRRA